MSSERDGRVERVSVIACDCGTHISSTKPAFGTEIPTNYCPLKRPKTQLFRKFKFKNFKTLIVDEKRVCNVF